MKRPQILADARRLISQGNLTEAEELLREAVRLAPDFYLYHAHLAEVLALQDRQDEADLSYGMALDQSPRTSGIRRRPDGRGTSDSRPMDGPRATRVAGDAAPVRSLHLYMPFYTPKDSARAAELLYCLDRNLSSGAFADITLLVDDDTTLPRADPRLRMVRLARRPTYLDWVRDVRVRCAGQIAVLANSDIYFDADITSLREIFAADPGAFVALSRFDKTGETLIPHRNPHWSQDTWAFCPDANHPGANPEMPDSMFDLPLGVPRCDNKIAYVFAIRGYTVRNPFPFVRSVHVHETGLRDYDRTGDRRIIGGVAMVHPSQSLTAPSAVDIEIWSANTTHFGKLSLNKSLENWDRQKRSLRRPPIVMRDANWQYPAITEQHAFALMRQHLPDDGKEHRTTYLGFPYATLFDLMTHAGPTKPRTLALQAELEEMAPQLRRFDRVVTVCQHVHMRRFAKLLGDIGITDIFWAHCRIGETHLADAPGVRLHPFPLYPVQQTLATHGPRTILYSFVGARANQFYMNDTRNLILDILRDEPRGKIIDRDTWHYNAIVYDKQILDRAKADAPLMDDGASAMFRDMLNASVFTLCPSGSGPNSIRLWEAALNGSIPVVMSDTYLHPGPDDLWDAAVVTCAETAQAIAALPDRLAAIAADPAQLAGKRAALRTLADRYGPHSFVTDVLEFMRSAPQDETPEKPGK